MSEANKIPALLNKKRIYLAISLGLILVGILYWREMRENTASFDSLTWSGLSFLFLVGGLVMMAFRDLAYMVRIRLLTENQLTWKQSFHTIMLWEFASALSPGVVGGSAVAIFILQKEKITLGQSTALVLITLIFDNLFYILFIPLVFLFTPLSTLFPDELINFSSFGLQAFWIGYGVILLITIVLLYSIFINTRFITWVIKMIYKLPFLRSKKKKGLHFIKEIELARVNYRRKSFRFWTSVLATTIWSWISRFLVINFVLAAFLTLNFPEHLTVLARQLIMWLAMLVTPTPGGSGMAELAFSAMLGDYIALAGISTIALALIWRTLSYYPYLIIGSLLLPRWLKKK